MHLDSISCGLRESGNSAWRTNSRSFEPDMQDGTSGVQARSAGVLALILLRYIVSERKRAKPAKPWYYVQIPANQSE